jgi:sugar lactone lactonase YvrE
MLSVSVIKPRIWRRIGLALIVLTGIVSTIGSGGSSSSGGAPPTAQISFPPPSAHTGWPRITVTGTAQDDSGVAGVQVNGIEATSSDNFATWQTIVPLTPGTNTLTVSTLDTIGLADPNAASVTIDVSATASANSVRFGDGYAIALNGNRAYVADFGADSIIEVNLDTGASSVLSDAAHGTGTPVSGPDGIVMGDGGTSVLVSNFFSDDVISVNLASGNRQTVSAGARTGDPTANPPVPPVAETGSGTTFLGPAGIDLIDPALAVVSNYASGEIISVDLSSGNRTLLSAFGQGAGPALAQPDGAVVDSDNNRVLVTDSIDLAVIAVDITSGDRTVISNSLTGSGTSFVQPIGIDVYRSGSQALVTDNTENQVVAVDLSSGNRTVLSDAARSIGGGPGFEFPAGIAIDAAKNVALVSGANLVMVELGSGDRVVIGP